MYQRNTFYLIFFFIICLTAGCLNTNLKSEPILKQIKSLLISNKRLIGLRIQDLTDSEIIGHQYLFIILPFGRIKAPQLSEQLINQAQTTLAIKGYSPKIASSNNQIDFDYPAIHISIDAISLTAYDLIFMRKIVCKLDLSAKLISPDKTIMRDEKTTTYQSKYVSFAFEPELSNILRVTIDRSISELLNKIGV